MNDSVSSNEKNDYIVDVITSIKYIESNLFEKELVSEISNSLYVSKFHFHRVFQLVTKHTLGQYIKKRRFTEITKLLVSTKNSLLEIAIEAGYSSHEAFTRAFKEYFGFTPSHFRKSPINSTFLMLEPFEEDDIEFSYFQINDPEIINRKAFDLYGIKGESTLDAASINHLWGQFRDKTKSLKKGPGYTVWFDSMMSASDLKDSMCYSCFVGVETLLPLATLSIPKGEYAKFTINRDFSKLNLIYAYIYFNWIKKSAYDFYGDLIIEYYDEDFDYHQNIGTMSIFIPVKRKQ